MYECILNKFKFITFIYVFQVPSEDTSTQLDADIRDMEAIGRLKAESVWEVIRKYPVGIHETCRTVSAIPTTQVTVERLFSHLRLIMRENRGRMKGELAESILFLRTNKCL